MSRPVASPSLAMTLQESVVLGTCPAPSLTCSCPAHLVCPEPIKAGPAPSAHHLRLEETHRPRNLVGPCPYWLDSHTRVHRHMHTYMPTRKRAQGWLGTGRPGEAGRSGPDVAPWAACPAWLSLRRWWGRRGPRGHPRGVASSKAPPAGGGRVGQGARKPGQLEAVLGGRGWRRWRLEAVEAGFGEPTGFASGSAEELRQGTKAAGRGGRAAGGTGTAAAV